MRTTGDLPLTVPGDRSLSSLVLLLALFLSTYVFLDRDEDISLLHFAYKNRTNRRSSVPYARSLHRPLTLTLKNLIERRVDVSYLIRRLLDICCRSERNSTMEIERMNVDIDKLASFYWIESRLVDGKKNAARSRLHRSILFRYGTKYWLTIG